MAKSSAKGLTPEQRQFLLDHLQTAIQIELSTVPIYLYTYYSIKRTGATFPSTVDPKMQEKLLLFANKAGGMIMSVAVEEMLHLSLACNIMRSLGGQPKVYGQAPTKYPTPLPHHNPVPNFTVGLEKLSYAQLDKFLVIENPEGYDPVTHKPIPHYKPDPVQCDNWDTIKQFYDCIAKRITDQTVDSDFGNRGTQLEPGKAYFPNNVDTIYPDKVGYDPMDGSKVAQYPDAADSGNLRVISSKRDALAAIATICDQGEGVGKHIYDDPDKLELTHWYKFLQLQNEIGDPKNPKLDLSHITYDFGSSMTKKDYNSQYWGYLDLANGVFSYLLLMTETIYKLRGVSQALMMDIGMHKGMIFVLDKIIGDMRALQLTSDPSGPVLAPTFEPYVFHSVATAKEELIHLFLNTNADGAPGQQILQRIKDLPDVNIKGVDSIIRF